MSIIIGSSDPHTNNHSTSDKASMMWECQLPDTKCWAYWATTSMWRAWEKLETFCLCGELSHHDLVTRCAMYRIDRCITTEWIHKSIRGSCLDQFLGIWSEKGITNQDCEFHQINQLINNCFLGYLINQLAQVWISEHIANGATAAAKGVDGRWSAVR